jgi:hypothetical protein
LNLDEFRKKNWVIWSLNEEDTDFTMLASN